MKRKEKKPPSSENERNNHAHSDESGRNKVEQTASFFCLNISIFLSGWCVYAISAVSSLGRLYLAVSWKGYDIHSVGGL